MEKIQSKYFAAKIDPKELGSALMGKVHGFNHTSKAMGLHDKLRTSWSSYHGMFWNSFGNSHQVSFTGEQGELSQLPVNHLRNIINHMKTMITASRPALEARAANTDPKSLIQAQLATGLLDYYLREKRLEKYISIAIENALVSGAGYIKLEWDTSEGQIIEEDEETGLVIREGDLRFSNLSPFEVIYDINKQDQDHNWLISIEYKNRYDLMAKFPDKAEEIDGLDGKDKLEGCIVFNKETASDDVPVYTFYHKPTDSLPKGRQVIFLSEEIIVSDQELPYKKIPIYRMSPADVLGTAVGYANTFDLLPLQDAINQLYTSVYSNNVAFSTQNLFVKSGANLNMSNLAGGLNIIEGMEKPEPLNLLNTSPETFNLIKTLEGLMETISGINSVTRGSPQSSLESGSALALVQSMAVQFMNGLQQQYVQLLEDVGTAIIEILKDYATEPRVASIIGKNNKAYLKQFKAEDLQEVNRVIVDIANPLSKTIAGRIKMAEQLMQMKADEFTIDQYLQVINTGKLEVMTDKNTRRMNQIELENERLMQGIPTKVLVLDDHVSHIEEHASLLDDPDVRDNDELAEVILQHILEHQSMSGDPSMSGLHQALGHRALPQPAPPSEQPNPALMNQPNGEGTDMMSQQEPAPPGMPNMPQSPEGGATNPQDQLMTNTTGVPANPEQQG